MNDKEPFARISTENGEFDLTPENTYIFTHMGELAMFDHILTVLEGDLGMCIWSENPNYEALKELAEDEEVPQHLYLRELAPYVRDAYAEDHMGEDFDTIPDGWDDVL